MKQASDRSYGFTVGLLLGWVFGITALTGLNQSYAATKVTASDGSAIDLFGTSVSISGDVLAVGSPKEDDTGSNAGSAYVYTRSGSDWTEAAKLTASDGSPGDLLGTSVAADGNTVAVGAPQVDVGGFSGAGAVYVFTDTGNGTWSEQQKIVLPDLQVAAGFAEAVALVGDTLIVGAPNYDHAAGTQAGIVVVYERSAGVWTEAAQIFPDDPINDQLFGKRLSYDGSKLLVGAPFDDHSSRTNAGSAYVFQKIADSWVQQQKLIAADPGNNDRFGDAVAIDNSVAVIGSALEDSAASNAGAIYIYEESGGSWSAGEKVFPDDPGANDLFGGSVAVQNGVVAAGSVKYDLPGVSNAGAVHIFEKSGSWLQTGIYTDENPAQNDLFGNSVSISDGRLAVGIYAYDGANGVNAGGAYVVELSGDETAPNWGSGTLEAGSVTADSVGLNWDAATDNTAVTGYLIYQNGDEIADVNATTFDVTDLNASTSYTFKVEAYDVAGNLTSNGPEASVTTTATPDTTLPVWSGTAAVVVSNETSTSVEVSWSGATDDVGVTEYVVSYEETDGGTAQTQVISGSSLELTLTGLTPETNYTISVEARDGAGNESTGGPSTTGETTANTDNTLPTWSGGEADTGNATETTLEVSWSGAGDDTGVTGYVVSYEVTDSGSTQSVAAESSPLVLTGLLADTQYTVSVQAQDAAGNVSTDGPTASGTTQSSPDTTLPSWTNGSIVASNETETSIEVTWSGDGDDVGVTGYVVSYEVTGSGSSQSVSALSSPLLLSGLLAGTQYTISVEAEDGAGNESTDGPTTTGTTESSVDSESPQWTAGVAETVMLSDTVVGLKIAGASDASGVAGYRVYEGQTLLGDLSQSPDVLSGLTAGTAYTLKVEAYDGVGNESTDGPTVSVTTLNSSQIKVVAGDASAQDYLGSGVAIDGALAVAGASHDDDIKLNSGALYVYEQQGTNWIEQAKLKASDAGATDNLGFSSAGISGETIIGGAWHEDPSGANSGAAYVFTRTGGVWSEEQKLTASDGSVSDEFGRAVAIDGDIAVVGARNHNGKAGAAYVYARSNGVWEEQAKLEATDGGANYLFGMSVSVSGGKIAIGSSWAKIGTRTRAGAVYVYAQTGTGWALEEKLVASDYFSYDEFGTSVSVEGDVLVAGAPKNDENGSNSGSAYVFEYSGGSWEEVSRVLAGDGAGNDYFGVSASVANGVVAVGSYLHDSEGTNAGAVYVYAKGAGGWLETDKLTAIDASAGDQFGLSVGVSGTTVMSGVARADVKGQSDAGSAYFSGVSTTVTDDQAPTWTNATIAVSNEMATSLEVSWSGATDSFGITDYVVSYEVSGGGALQTITTQSSTLVLTGLTPQTDYTISVEARDAAGNESTDGPTVEGTTTATPDTTLPVWSGAAAVVVSNETSTSVEVSWSGATDDVGVTEYVVSYEETDGGTAQTQVTSGNTLELTLTGLTPETNYTISVEARDGAGNESTGGPSTTGDTAVVTDDVSPVWTSASIAVLNETDTTLDVTWGGADDNIGVTEYVVSYGITGNAAVQSVSAPQSPFTVTGLTPDTSYTIVVEAKDAEGNTSNNGPTATAMTQATVDTTPPVWTNASIAVTNETDSSLEVSWSGASDDNDVTEYVVSYGLTVGGVPQDITATNSPLVLTGLTPETAYTVVVQAVDAENNISANGPSIDGQTTAVVDTQAPVWGADPLSVSILTSDSLTISWTGATDNTDVTGYRIYDNNNALLSDTTANSFTATGLSTGGLAYYRVEAYDAAGLESVDGPDLGGAFPFDKVVGSEAANSDLFGGDVSIDGDTALVTALLADVPVNGVLKPKVGKVYVYERHGDVWFETATLLADDGFTNDNFGYNSDISGDTIIVGAWHADVGGLVRAGAAYVFVRSGDNWVQQQKLAANAPTAEANFGVAVAVDGDIAVVGAHDADYGGFTKTGSVYIYSRSGGVWSLETELHADVLQNDQAFGRSVGIDNGRVVVGAAKYDNAALTDSGAVYVFEKVAGSWTQQAKLFSDDIAALDVLGEHVSIENNTVVATAKDDDNGANAGAGYVFEFDGSTWQQTGKLLADDGASQDRFGFRSTIDNGVVAIGAYRKEVGGNTDVGAVYLFQKLGGNWLKVGPTYTAYDGQSQDNYGIAVALSGSTLIVGSELDDHTGTELDAYYGDVAGTNGQLTNTGSGYFYTVDLTPPDLNAPSWSSESASAANATETTLDLTWSGASDDSAIQDYLVTYDDGITPTTVVVVGESTTISGLMAATTYNISVQARDEAGNVSNDGPTTQGVTTDDTAPTWASVSFSVSGATDESLAVSWSGAEDNVAVTGYVVSYGVGSPNTSVTTTDTNVVLSGLAPLTEYSILVQAIDAANNESTDGPGGTGATTNTPDVTPPVWTGGQLIASNETQTSIDLAWSGASDDGVLFDYIVTYVDNSDSTSLQVSTTLDAITLTGLNPLTLYTITVQAVDASNNVSTNGPTADVSTLDTADTDPPFWTAAQINVTNETANSLEVSFSGAGDNVGVTGYVVTADDGTNSVTVSGAGLSLTLNGLLPATTYAIDVQAEDVVGNISLDGPTTQGITLADGDTTPPMWADGQASTMVQTATVQTDSVDLSWVAANDDISVAGYRLYDNNSALLADVSSPAYTVPTLADGDLVYVRIEAYDDAGNETDSGPVFVGTFAFDKVITDANSNARFGATVAAHGEFALVGAPDKTMPVNGVPKGKVGEVAVYKKAGDVWQQYGALAASDGFTNDNFGYSADINGDTAIVGSWRADPNGISSAGAAYVFEHDGTEWVEQIKLTANVPEAGADFGVSVAIDGDIAVVGAHETTVNGFATSGDVSIYTRDAAGQWTLDQVLTADVLQTGQGYGRSVDVHNGVVVVSAARYDYPSATNGGAVYVYTKVGGIWVQQAKLVGDDVGPADLLGESVAIENTTIVATARDDDNGANSGAAYIFEYDGSAWQQSAKLLASDGAAQDQFGIRAAIDEGIVAVGAYRHDGSNADGGAVYVYRRISGVWTEVEKVIASDGQAGDYFGSAVSLADGVLVAGAEADSHTAVEADVLLGQPDGTNAALNAAGSAYFINLSLSDVDTIAPFWTNGSLTASAVGAGSVSLAWSGADDNIGVNGYQVLQDGALVADIAGTTIDISGLDSVTAYSFEVQAYDLNLNVSGDGPSLSVTTTADTTDPSWQAGAISIDATTENSVSISWTGASDDVAVDTYSVYLDNVEVLSATGTNATIEQLQPFTTYNLRVEATDAAGNTSVGGPAISATTLADQTLPVWTNGALTVVATASGSVELQWSGASDETGIAGYRLFAADVAVLDTTDVSTAIVSDLLPATSYLLRVEALDAAGNLSTGGPTVTATTSADSTPPTWVDAIFTASDIDFSSLTLTWDGAVDNSTIESYVVYQDGAEIATTTGLSYVVTGLQPVTDYGFAVQAIDGAQLPSTDGPSATFTTTADTTPPLWNSGELLTSGVTDRTVNLQWSGATDNDAVAEYRIYVDNVQVATIPSVTTSLTLNGLTPATTHTIRVEALDQTGNESIGGPSQVVTTIAPEPVNELVKLLADSPEVDDDLGTSVAISGNTLVAGAIGDDDGASGAGAVYVYVEDGLGGYNLQQKLTAADPASSDKFGTSVAIEGDTLVVGMPLDDDFGSITGAAYVFTRSNGVWTQQQKLLASDAAQSEEFGLDVTIEGDLIVVGAKVEDADFNNNGAAYVFAKTGGMWVEELKILASDRVAGDRLGHAVDLSGNTLVVSAIGVDTYPAGVGSTEFGEGAAYVFVRTSPGVWVEEAKLLPTDQGIDDEFAFDVAIDGDIAVMASHRNDIAGANAGTLYVFKRNAGVWTQTAILNAYDAEPDEWLGYSLDIQGSLIIAGAWREDFDGIQRAGAVYSFKEISPNIYEQTKFIASDAADFDKLSWDIALDGDTIVAGAPTEDGNPPAQGGSNVGAVYVFDLTPDIAAPVWVNAQLAESDATAAGLTLDWSGATDPDGVVGYLLYQDGVLLDETTATTYDVTGLSSEVTYVFTVQAIDLAGNESLTGPSLTVTTPFGDSDAPTWNSGEVTASNPTGSTIDLMWSGATDNVAVTGYRIFRDGLAVLDINDGQAASASVTALASETTYTFTVQAFDDIGLQSSDGPSVVATTGSLIPGNEILKLLASDRQTEDALGLSVAIDGDTLVAGAPDEGGNNAGAVYVYVADGAGNYVEQQKLTASDAASSDGFGSAVAIQGDVLIASSPKDDDAGSISGSAYVFIRTGGVWTEVQKLVASDLAVGDEFGKDVAIDGDLIAVGSKLVDQPQNNEGAVYIFARSGNTWLEEAKVQANPADAKSGDKLGHSVALSGNTLISGAVQDDTLNELGNSINDVGSAYIFVRTAPGVWVQEQKLVAPDFTGNAQAGFDVDIDGDRAVIGAPRATDLGALSGTIYIYERSGGVWTLVHNINAPDGQIDEWFGYSVGVDGDTVVAGAYLADTDSLANAGAFYVFSNLDSGEPTVGKFVASDAAGGDQLAAAIAMDGDRVLVGAPAEEEDGVTASGSIYLFDLVPDVDAPMWAASTTISESNASATMLDLSWSGATDDDAVNSYTIYQDGVEIGTSATTSFAVTGLASETSYVFRVEANDLAGNQSATGPTLNVTTPFGDSDAPVWQSGSLSVISSSASGFTVSWSGATDNIGVTEYQVLVDDQLVAQVATTSTEIIGLESETSYLLRVEAIDDSGLISTDGPTLTATTSGLSNFNEFLKLLAGDPQASDELGTGVSIDGNTLAAGAPNEDDSGNNAGAVYVYVTDGAGGYVQQQKITPFDGSSSDGFGTAVKLSGDTLVVGSPKEDEKGVNAGAAYVYTRSGGVWSLQQKVVATDGAPYDEYGLDVAIEGDTIVIGAKNEDQKDVVPRTTNQGAVYVYTRTGTTWQEDAKLYVSDPATGDRFGHSVDINGDTIVAGAVTDKLPNSNGTLMTNVGSVYVFVKSAGVWTEQAKIASSDYAVGDEFGSDVAISGDTLIVGVPKDDDAGSLTGSAYVFRRSGTSWTEIAKLTAPDAAPGEWFGYSVDIDGVYLAVGAQLADVNGIPNAGALYTYTEVSPGVFTPLKNVASDFASNDKLGTSVSISGDTVLAGSPAEDGMTGSSQGGSSIGSLYLFDATPDTQAPVWAGGSQVQTTTVTPFGATVSWSGLENDPDVAGYTVYLDGVAVANTSGTTYDLTGLNIETTYSVSVQAYDAADNLSGNGPSVSFTTPFGDTVPPVWNNGNVNAGLVTSGTVELIWSGATDNEAVTGYKVYADGVEYADVSGTTTTLEGLEVQTEYTFSVEAYDAVGLLSSNGPAVTLTTGNLESIVEFDKFFVNGIPAQSQFGFSIAASGSTIVGGANQDPTGATDGGAAHVFVDDGSGSYAFQQTLIPSDIQNYDFFGSSIDIDGDTMVVGSPGDDDGGSNAGAAYVYTRNGTVWTEAQKLYASDQKQGDEYGYSVAIDGDRIVIGAKVEDTSPITNNGAVYVYDRAPAGPFTESAKLLASDPVSGDKLGGSVDVSGDIVFAGASEDDVVRDNSNKIDAGSVYVFEYNGTSWTETQKLTAFDAVNGDQFGISVAVDGGLAVIGSYRDDDLGGSSGSAYVFSDSGSGWVLDSKLVAGDGAIQDQFGWDVAIESDLIVVGAYAANRTDIPGEEVDHGVAYAYTRSAPGTYSQKKLISSDASAVDFLGWGVAIADGLIAVAAPKEDSASSASGAIYRFNPLLSNPTLAISGVTADEGDSNNVVQVPVTLLNAANSVTVDWTTVDGTATGGVDFVADSGTVTLSSAATVVNVPVTLIGDQVPEGNKSFDIQLSNAVGAVIGTAQSSVLITNDDGAIPDVSIADVEVDEGNATSTVTIAINFDVAADIDMSVDYNFSDGTAVAGADYTGASGSVTVPAGQTTASIPVEILGDGIAELDETINVTITNPSAGLELADDTGVVTIVNDDGDVPMLSVSDATVNEATGATTTVSVDITLAAAATESVTVDFATVAGSATDTSDYLPVSGSVTFAVGETSKTETFTIVGDTLVEADETFTIELSNPQPAITTLVKPAGVITIVSDDIQPSISITDASLIEGSSGSADVSLVISLFEAATETVTVDFATADVSATAGVDYVARSGTVTFAPGQTSVTELFTINGDIDVEDSETFNVVLSNATPANADIVEANGVVTIVSDDALPVLSVADASITESDSGTTAIDIFVTLADASSQVVTVDYATQDGTAVAANDYVATSGTLTFAIGETSMVVSVPVIGDQDIELDETFNLVLSNATPAIAQIADSSGAISILNDDFPPDLTVADVSVIEGNSGNSTASVVFTLSEAAHSVATVDYATADGTAIAANDYIAASGTVTFAAGQSQQTVDIVVNGDIDIEPIETFALQLSNASGLTLVTTEATISLVNDDADTYVINAFAGDGTSAYAGDNGPAVTASLDRAFGVAATQSGVVYIADTDANVIRRVGLDGIITTVAGNGTAGFSGDGGPATQAQLKAPYGIEVDPAGNLYIADTKNNRIRKVDTNGIITTYVGSGSGVDGGDGGPATAASVNRPLRTRWYNGELYVSDNIHAKIKKVDANGIITTIVGTGVEGYDGDGELAIDARIRKPAGLDFDANGDLFIADRGSHRIRKVDMTTGIITTYIGNGCFNADASNCGGANGFAGEGVLATGPDVKLSNPRDVLFDSIGNMFITDVSNRRIRMVDTTGIITTIAGNGQYTATGNGGPADQSTVGSPYDLAIDGSNNIYLADDGFFQVRKISPATSGGN